MIYKNNEFIYDSETGGLCHARDKQRVAAGQPCPTSLKHTGGYRMVYCKKSMRQIEAIWELVYGDIPYDKMVGVKDGDKGNQKLDNLYLVPRVNRRNKPVKVWWSKSANLWMVANLSGKKAKLEGMYASFKEATLVSDRVNKDVL